jgi:pimeloyl-ACP methyl ester carboxylesterase
MLMPTLRRMKRIRRWIGAGAFAAGAVLLTRRHLPATPIDFNSIEPEMDLGDGSRFVDLHGLRVRVRVAGDGEPVIVLVHGFAASIFTWRKIFDELAKHGTVIAFDRPAHGFTSRPISGDWGDVNPYSLDAQAELVIALLDHFGVDRAILVGHSAGGTVAALAALKHPERIESLILIAPAIYRDVPPPPWMRRLVNAPLMHVVGPAIARSVARLAFPIMDRAWHDSNLITTEIREGYLMPYRVMNWDRAMWEAARANRANGLGRQFGSLRAPTTLITGDDDGVVPVAQTLRLSHQLDGARLIMIPDCGHIPQEEKPDDVLDAIVRSLNPDPSSAPIHDAGPSSLDS